MIVNESQEVVLVKGGKALDVFQSGRHTLTTANIPRVEGADKILDYYRASKGAFLCIQKNKRILHYGYIIKQSL